jgi:diacylglycerol kinase (ATP)
MYDKLSVLIDLLAEDAVAASAERTATAYGSRSQADGKPFVPQLDHIARAKLELAERAQKLQQSLKLIIFQVEQGTVFRVIVTRIGKRKGSSYEWFHDLP